MVVYEIRDPKGVDGGHPTPQPRKRVVPPTYPVDPARGVDMRVLPPRPGRKQRRRHPGRHLEAADIREVRRLLAEVNKSLEANGILLHFTLVAAPSGAFGIDVYDCSDGEACRVIHDMDVEIAELPALLAGLQREAGVMLDREL